MRLELSKVLQLLLLLFAPRLTLEHYHPTGVVPQRQVPTSIVELDYRDDVLLEDLLAWTLVPEDLIVLVLRTFAYTHLLHVSSIYYIPLETCQNIQRRKIIPQKYNQITKQN
jgi:hypothetical protein